MNARRILTFFLVILALSIISIYYNPSPTGNTIKQTDYPKEEAILERVIDGDTIVVTGPTIGNSTHIRMLGINTPEKKMPFSNESTKFVNQFINKSITLERDFEDTDKYNRKLRYVFFEDRFINKEILENGYANSYYISGLKYQKELLDAENQAKTQEIGIWTKSSEKCRECIYLKELNFQEEFFTIGNNCSFSCNLDKWFVKDAGRNTFYLSQLESFEETTIFSKNNTSVWNDEGDRLFLFDKRGLLVIFYEY